MFLSKKLAYGFLFIALAAFTGCGVSPAEEQAETVSSDDYVELVARWNIIQADYINRISEAVQEDDHEKAAELQELFAEEIDILLTALDIDEKRIAAFDAEYPDFFEYPENQERVMKRIEELLSE